MKVKKWCSLCVKMQTVRCGQMICSHCGELLRKPIKGNAKAVTR
jgi:hypothetical protein